MLQDYPSEQILYYRIFTSLLLTWAYILLFRKSHIKSDIEYIQKEEIYSVKKIIWLSLLAGLLITGNWFTYIYVVNNVSLKSAAFAYMVCPLITALGGFLILKEAFYIEADCFGICIGKYCNPCSRFFERCIMVCIGSGTLQLLSDYTKSNGSN